MKKNLLMMVVLSILVFVSCNKKGIIIPRTPAPLYKSMYRIGQRYGGGVIAYIDSSKCHGIIVDTLNVSDSCWWSIEGDINPINSTSYGSGRANTLNIIRDETIQMQYAAYWTTSNYHISSYNDWFLPSKDELNSIYENKDDWGWYSTQYNIYWSSSNILNSSKVWVQDFNTGEQKLLTQLDNAAAIAVRKF